MKLTSGLGHRLALAPVVVAVLFFAGGGARAQAPGETTNLAWCAGSKTCLQWTFTATASRYDLVRGAPGGLPFLLSTGVDSCDRIVVQPVTAPGLIEIPPAGGFFWYLVIPTNVCGPGPAGNATVAARTVNTSGNCDPTCSDVALDGTETDVDCGGQICARCANGKNCVVAADCASGACSVGKCVAPQCFDGVQNGSETGVDCGGGLCAPCGNGQGCCVGSDCQSATCSAGVCGNSSCLDGMKDGSETDIDCGGGTCPRCADNQLCIVNTDCVSSVCSLGTCHPATCSDNVKNGSESDIDCGGGTCPGCAIGKHCGGAGDCQSGNCSGGTCQPALAPNGSPCVSGSACQSGNCTDSVCCNTTCGGLCQACTAAKKGNGSDGTCGNVLAGTDPDNDCPMDAQSTCGRTGACSGAGACALYDSTTVCGVSSSGCPVNQFRDICCNTGSCTTACSPCAQ